MGIDETKHGKAFKNETPGSIHIPYCTHVTPGVIKTKEGDYLQIIKLEGLPFETADNVDINGWHNSRNQMLMNISDPQISLWTTIIRHKIVRYVGGEFNSDFAQNLNDKYKKNIIEGDNLYVNDLYLTVIKKDSLEIPFGKTFKMLFSSKTLDEVREHEKEQIKSLQMITDDILNKLAAYEAKVLSTYDYKSYVYSEPLEFLARLVNGYYQKIPLTRKKISDVICTTRAFFGYESMELRSPGKSIYGGMLGFKDYVQYTRPTMLDDILNIDVEFVLTQSFSFVHKQSAKSKMNLQLSRMNSSDDAAVSQMEDIVDDMDHHESGMHTKGKHHFTLLVLSDSVKQLEKDISSAASKLSDHCVVAREDLGIEPGFYAQLPGNEGYRPRVSMINSRNFSALASFHNYTCGQADGNHWGDAVSIFKTESKTPYFFNFHRGDLANTTIIGPSGEGKTVLMGFLMAQAEKFSPQIIFFDKDRGAEIFCRAQEGNYTPIMRGEPTGFNPLQMEPTVKNIQFMKTWIKRLVTNNGEFISASDVMKISKAVDAITSDKIPLQSRRLAQLIPFLNDASRENGLTNRLAPWFANGEKSWAFDNVSDSISLGNKILGFDITELLDDPEMRTPILMYLFYRIEELMDGRRLIFFIDEGWKALDDEYFASLIKNKQKTIRKQNGFLIFGSNNASDATDTAIGKIIIQQSPTQIFTPNKKAKREDYINGFDLTEREFQIIKNTPEKSHKYLIKHGTRSTIINLNLKGFEDEIKILSGTTSNVNLLDDIRARLGDKPNDWMDEFLTTNSIV